jgi:hypothetical protein
MMGPKKVSKCLSFIHGRRNMHGPLLFNCPSTTSLSGQECDQPEEGKRDK